MAKQNEGELIKLLKEKSGFTYKEIADAIQVSERALMKWKLQESLEPETKNKLAQFFNIDVAAFVNEQARIAVLKEYKSPRVTSQASEPLSKKVDRLSQQMEEMKTLLKKLLEKK
jgi:transcriptional regulator with XRE-family HTH domain